ncbi:hypothetical protein LTR53_000522 [Teratosphaeriaceae sp. CCFEE 6253]|nr:hypothetical protein LTR53_000522 [Teratosphaeriaceae sp. CCFEE 6253]
MPARIFRSVHPDAEYPAIDLVSDLLSNPDNIPGSNTAFIDPETQQTHTQDAVRQRLRSLAHGLRNDLGVREHDIVALFSPNTIDYAIICFAIIGCGAVVSPISAALTAEELHDQLETSQAGFLIAHSLLMQTAREAARGTVVKTLLQADGHARVNGSETAESMAKHCTPSDLLTIPASEAKTRPAFLCFSSGTTGKAKGALLTHHNLTSNIAQMTTHVWTDVLPRQTQIAFLPFSHIYGIQNYLFMTLRRGTAVVVMRKFSLDAYLAHVQQYRPVELELVPPVALLLAKNPKIPAFDLSSVRSVMSAAAPLSQELMLALESRFETLYGKQVRCWQAAGMTECGPAVATLPFAARDTERRFTVGSILPSVQMRVVDPETMQDLGIEDSGWTLPGEIWIAGPNVFLGYLRNEEASRDAFHVDESGTRWYRSGDIGIIDTHGYVVLQDRLKDVIKYKGYQVIPAELEAKLIEHPHVMDCAVVGKYIEEQATEVPVAFVVLSAEAQRAGAGTVVEEIHQWLKGRVAPYKRLRGGIRLVDVIPKSPSGKIIRRQLKDAVKGPAKLAKL